MATYNHVFSFWFEVPSEDLDAEDITPQRLRASLLSKISQLNNDELPELCHYVDTDGGEE